MIFIRYPTPEQIAKHIRSVSANPFSYTEVGATQGELPSGYNVDRHEIVLGHGDAVFEAAKSAIRTWRPLRLGWTRVFTEGEPAENVTVTFAARVMGVWWLNSCRVVYLIDSADQFGFCYGTLRGHAEMGEEQFVVRRDTSSGEVVYSILAFSRPRHFLAKLGYPLSRATQRRFGQASLKAMRQATSRSDV